ncbi:unnamed protein product, partial [Polarella glacialis]
LLDRTVFIMADNKEVLELKVDKDAEEVDDEEEEDQQDGSSEEKKMKKSKAKSSAATAKDGDDAEGAEGDGLTSQEQLLQILRSSRICEESRRSTERPHPFWDTQPVPSIGSDYSQ